MGVSNITGVSLENSIRFYRELYGMTQEQLGRQIGINRTYVRKLERGEYIPRINLVYKLAEVLKIPVQEVFFPAGEVPPVRFDLDQLKESMVGGKSR